VYHAHEADNWRSTSICDGQRYWKCGVASSASSFLDATLSHWVRLSYLLFLPASYAHKPDARWPLILYLHGGSLRGDNVEQLRTLGLPHKLESEPDFPFVVVSPQCP